MTALAVMLPAAFMTTRRNSRNPDAASSATTDSVSLSQTSTALTRPSSPRCRTITIRPAESCPYSSCHRSGPVA